uniref:Uncharacterized protein n=1 Tax=Arundo donax TaxID=35708 RepID=A0A0A9GWB7_ARUDO
MHIMNDAISTVSFVSLFIHTSIIFWTSKLTQINAWDKHHLSDTLMHFVTFLFDTRQRS